MKNLDTILGLEEFDKRFTQCPDPENNLIKYLFRINQDGSINIASPQNIKSFIHSQNQDILKALVSELPPRIDCEEPTEIPDLTDPILCADQAYNKCLNQVLEIINKRIK